MSTAHHAVSNTTRNAERLWHHYLRPQAIRLIARDKTIYSMDAIKLHSEIVAAYQDYIRSFIDINETDIRDEVIRQLDSGKLWPDPLIQFNPVYASPLATASRAGLDPTRRL